MNLMTEELSARLMDKHLRKATARVDRYEMMRDKADISLANGQIDQAIAYIEDELRCIREIEQMEEEKTAWENARQTLMVMKGMGFNVKTIEVKRNV